MAIYHLSIKLVKRSQGKSAVAAAAYRSGEKMINEYDGIVHDYTRKGGVVHSEIMLPPHAPAELSDRSTLWNSVEKIEKHSRAQLAREIEIALPNELNRAEQIKLVQNYCQQTFVDVGMCADFSIHDPKGKQQNTHAHILLTMRPLNKDGSWGDKQKKEYVLDNNGEKIYDPKKKQYKCGTVPTTDWNEQTKAEEWRKAWADLTNRTLAENHIPKKIDHRSYERQGAPQIPTVHLGVAASQMEKRGILTEKGNLNRIIRQDNRLIRELKAKIRQLTSWLKEAVSKSDIAEPQPPTLMDLLQQYKSEREERADASDLKNLTNDIVYLESNQISTWEQLQQHLFGVHKKVGAITHNLKQNEHRMKSLRELIDSASVYQETRPIYEQYRQKKNRADKQRYYDTHTAELIRYGAADKKLKSLLPDKKASFNTWKRELNQLSFSRDSHYSELKAAREEVKQVESIRRQVEQVRKPPVRQQKQGQER